MQPHIVRLSTRLHYPSKTVFDWHLSPSAFERLIPPWIHVKIISREGGPAHIGSRLKLKVKIGPFWVRWVAQHIEFEEDQYFTDVQLVGPFKFWKHIHRIHYLDQYSCEIEEEIHFLTPFNLLKASVERRILKMLHWRHNTLKNDLAVIAKYPRTPLRILVSGSTGFVGSHLIPFLRTAGHQVSRLVRKPEEEETAVYWNPQSGDGPIEDFEGFDAVIHLAGKNIAGGIWTEKLKKQIVSSRSSTTKNLTKILLKLQFPPKTLLCASAIGIYGNRKEEELTEESHLGEGFLATVCKEWEKASEEVEEKGVRRVHTRFGILLSSDGGMLKRMLALFQLGLGAVIGKGEQWMSWMAIEDAIYAFYHVLFTEELSGGVNFCSPHPETNKSFSQKLAKALHRPLLLRIGEKPLRFALGEMADEMLLSSQNAKPKKLQQSGYQFLCPNLDTVFKRLFS